ncbi:MAG: M16 family metallopeptidase [Flavobacteriales bacterium]
MIEVQPVIFKLANGIRVVHQFLPREVAHCGLMIAAGSRDELTNEHGLAHFLEHSLFKGTKKRKTYHILSRLDAVGGELNAFTSKEETWIHATHLRQDYERAIELIADIAFNSTFPQHEIEKEIEVIVDEINSYKDSPADMIFEDFDELLFGGHPMGRSILGTEQSLKTFKREHLLQFRDRIFHPKNLIFSSAGNITPDRLKDLLEKHLGHFALHGSTRRKKQWKQSKPKHEVSIRDIHQVHYLTGRTAYDFGDERRAGLSLLTNMLGGPAMNNRLSMVIREKHGIAYHVDANYSAFSDTGIFTIYLGTEKQNLKKSQQLVWKELNALRKTRLSERQLNDAKKQIIGQIALAQDSGSAMMFNIAKSLQLFGKIDPLTEVFDKIRQIDSASMHAIAQDMFDPNAMSSMTYTYK